MEGGKWMVKGGGWRVEGGRWRVDGGGSVPSALPCDLCPPVPGALAAMCPQTLNPKC
jgi:hypothetical protein